MEPSDNSHLQTPISDDRKHPCVLCQRRKVKCDRKDPCGNCNKSGVECVPASTLPRKRKRRFAEAELLARLRRYERHLKRYGADIDAINREGTPEYEFLGTTTTIKAHHTVSPRLNSAVSSEADAVRCSQVHRLVGQVKKELSIGANDEFRAAEELLGGSSDDEMCASPVTKTYEKFGGGDGDDLLFGPQVTEELTNLHPSPVLIFQLWQTFLDKVNPLIRLFHASTIQQMVLDAAADLEGVPKNIEALMFGIYAAATISMSNEECQKRFNERKEVVLNRFQSAARRALRAVGYLRSTDIVVLQAFTLHLLSCLQMTIDPRTLFCLTGVAVRIAQRMGLSTERTNASITPFEAEMRRRLWWQIILLESRVAELSGGSVCMLSYTWNTKLPANINDSDLFLDMRDPPVERPGLTEMIYVRLRCEICQFLQRSRDITGSLAVEEGGIDAFEQSLEREYFSYCDPSVSFHLLSSTMARLAICKLRMANLMSNPNNHPAQEVHNKISYLSLRMIELHSSLLKNHSMQKYTWHICTNYPFLAHVHLLCALRYHTSDEFADRGWQLLSESAEARAKYDDTFFFSKKKDSLIHYSIVKLTMKAWEARELALRSLPYAPPPPYFIYEYRKLISRRKSETYVAETMETGQALGNLTGQFPMADQGGFGLGLEYDQSMLAEIFSTDQPPSAWDFWNDGMA